MKHPQTRLGAVCEGPCSTCTVWGAAAQGEPQNCISQAGAPPGAGYLLAFTYRRNSVGRDHYLLQRQV